MTLLQHFLSELRDPEISQSTEVLDEQMLVAPGGLLVYLL